MNWLLILVIALWAFYIVRGYKKGLLRMLFSLVSWLVILIIVTIATPHVSDFLKEKTTIEADIEQKSHEKLSEMVQEVNEDNKDEINPNEDNKETLDILGLKLPDKFVDSIFGEDNIANEFLENSGIYEKLSKQISGWALTGIAFVLSLLIVIIASHLLYNLIKIVEDVPVIGTVNRILGICLGSIKGLIIVWTVFAIVAMNAASKVGLMLISYIYESTFLSLLYENNIVLTILTHFL